MVALSSGNLKPGTMLGSGTAVMASLDAVTGVLTFSWQVMKRIIRQNADKVIAIVFMLLKIVTPVATVKNCWL